MQADHPLTRAEVIENYNRLCEEFKYMNRMFWLGGGSALIIHGLRETTMDLDAGCTWRTMELVQRQVGMLAEKKTVSEGYLEDCLMLPLPQFFTDLHTESCTQFEDLERIDGVWVYTLEACLRQKEKLLARLGREKDKKDIEKIKAALAA